MECVCKNRVHKYTILGKKQFSTFCILWDMWASDCGLNTATTLSVCLLSKHIFTLCKGYFSPFTAFMPQFKLLISLSFLEAWLLGKKGGRCQTSLVQEGEREWGGVVVCVWVRCAEKCMMNNDLPWKFFQMKLWKCIAGSSTTSSRYRKMTFFYVKTVLGIFTSFAFLFCSDFLPTTLGYLRICVNGL